MGSQRARRPGRRAAKNTAPRPGDRSPGRDSDGSTVDRDAGPTERAAEGSTERAGEGFIGGLPGALVSLQQSAGNKAALTRVRAADLAVARDTKVADGATATTVTVTVTWKRSPPKTYLQAVLDADPPNWQADVYAKPKGGKETKLGSGDGTLDVQLVEGTRYDLRVSPTAMDAPADYYKAAKKRVAKAAAGTVKVALGYNRWNQRFYEKSWEHAGLDPAKTGRITSATMFGRKVQVNELVVPKVDATNAHFQSNRLTDADRQEVKDSIVSMGGFAKRTTSSGAYSNHSTGCAVDINAHGATWQNEHLKKSVKGHKEVMSLVEAVVGDDADWKGYDPWKERDPTRILEASRRFNARFPAYLAGLLDDALGRGWRAEQLPFAGPEGPADGGMIAGLLRRLRDATLESGLLVQIVTPELLRKAANRARKDGKRDLAKRLERVATHWTKLRAWVEGIVVYGRKVDGKEWAYASEHAARADKPATKGSLQGMVSLHPKLVESLLAGGWTWLVDYRHDDQKDYMHFEDRAAQAALKT